MNENLLQSNVFNPSFDQDSSSLWGPNVAKLTAEWEFGYSSVSFNGFLNLEKNLESVSSSLNLEKLSDFLAPHVLDSCDLDFNHSTDVFNGTGNHVSNESVNLNVLLDDDTPVKVYDKDSFNKVYGAYAYNDLFFEDDDENDSEDSETVIEEEEELLNFDGDDDFTSKDSDYFDDEEEDDDDEDDDLDSVVYYNNDFELLTASLDNFSKANLNSLIKKELCVTS